MNSTELIVEYLVAGTLTIVAILLVAVSFFPNVMLGMLTVEALPEATLGAQIGLSMIFIATAYALGIVTEYVGERCFEWLLDRTKIRRMSRYLEANKTLLENSLLLKPYLQQHPEKRNPKDLAECIGKMRFFVMNHSAPLYADIAAQISRFRLIRALFLVAVILAIAVIRQLFYQPILLWWATLSLIIALAMANFFAIRSRFGRYCRSVERSYLILLIDQIAGRSQTHKESAKTQLSETPQRNNDE